VANSLPLPVFFELLSYAIRPVSVTGSECRAVSTARMTQTGRTVFPYPAFTKELSRNQGPNTSGRDFLRVSMGLHREGGPEGGWGYLLSAEWASKFSHRNSDVSERYYDQSHQCVTYARAEVHMGYDFSRFSPQSFERFAQALVAKKFREYLFLEPAPTVHVKQASKGHFPSRRMGHIGMATSSPSQNTKASREGALRTQLGFRRN
jgi:hypothetical protein